jgi:hypothetical protein
MKTKKHTKRERERERGNNLFSKIHSEHKALNTNELGSHYILITIEIL